MKTGKYTKKKCGKNWYSFVCYHNSKLTHNFNVNLKNTYKDENESVKNEIAKM